MDHQPAAHAVAVGEVAATAHAYPPKQLLHTVASPNCPAAHADPTAAADVEPMPHAYPTSHTEHTVPAVLNCPIPHAPSVLLAVGVDDDAPHPYPAQQSRQLESPAALNLPAGQAPVDGDDKPLVGHVKPPKHGAHGAPEPVEYRPCNPQSLTSE